MIYGIGTDIVSTGRFKNWLGNAGLMRRYFSESEIAWCIQQNAQGAASLAARFAAKEAFGKAVGTGLRGLALREIEVIKDALGKPMIKLSPRACGFIENRLAQPDRSWLIHLSLSHDGGNAVAFVVIETRPKE